jgi:phage shock protein E
MSILSRLLSREPSPAEETTSPVEMEPAVYLQRRTPDDPLLDVRTQGEFAASHLDGATNIDIMDDRFVERVGELGVDPSVPIYLYCRSGSRSGHAARILRRHGYHLAFNVGGLEDLVREGAPAAS